jgi:hypothetical protein
VHFRRIIDNYSNNYHRITIKNNETCTDTANIYIRTHALQEVNLLVHFDAVSLKSAIPVCICVVASTIIMCTSDDNDALAA